MLIDNTFLDTLLQKASESERLRANFDMRTSASDTSQRMLNALQPGTQVPIHRHRQSTETVVVLKGSLQEIFFDQEGKETERFTLQKGDLLQIPQGQWHTVSLNEPCVIFEAKDGAYSPSTPQDVLS